MHFFADTNAATPGRTNNVWTDRRGQHPGKHDPRAVTGRDDTEDLEAAGRGEVAGEVVLERQPRAGCGDAADGGHVAIDPAKTRITGKVSSARDSWHIDSSRFAIEGW